MTSAKARVESFLELSYDKDLWRLHRLTAVKQHKSGKNVGQHETKREILGVLTESGKELDRSVKNLGPKKLFYYPRVVKCDFLETGDQMKGNSRDQS